MFVNKNKRDCEYSNPHYENNFYQMFNSFEFKPPLCSNNIISNMFRTENF